MLSCRQHVCVCSACAGVSVMWGGDMSVSTYLGVSVCQVGVHVGVYMHVGLGQVRGMSVSTCTCTWVLGMWETCLCLHTMGFWACG